MMRDMTGTPVTMEDGQLKVPNDPVIHYIEGDGIGVDITPVMIRVVNAAVEKAYHRQERRVERMKAWRSTTRRSLFLTTQLPLFIHPGV